MKKNTFIITLLAVFAIFTVNAQNDAAAVRVIDNVLNLTKTNAVKTNFTFVVKSVSAGNHTMSGSFMMKGNKFTLNTGEMNVFFDGKTQWTYMKDLNEVSITNPTEKELAETNPMTILSAYKAKSFIKMGKSSAAAHLIELTPKMASSELRKITVSVNKTNNYPLFIQMTDKKGNVSTLTLTQFKANQKASDSEFVFNENLYKGVEVNELR